MKISLSTGSRTMSRSTPRSKRSAMRSRFWASRSSRSSRRRAPARWRGGGRGMRSREKHPNADKLSVCQVDLGPAGGLKTIVCGAPELSGRRSRAGGAARRGAAGQFRHPAVENPRPALRRHDVLRPRTGHRGRPPGPARAVGRPAIGLLLNASAARGRHGLRPSEITPNRPDCLSHLGIARELAAWFGTALRYPGQVIKADEASPPRLLEARAGCLVSFLRSVRVDSPDDCPLYLAYGVAGVKVGPSPAWLQDPAQGRWACGPSTMSSMRPNYVMLRVRAAAARLRRGQAGRQRRRRPDRRAPRGGPRKNRHARRPRAYRWTTGCWSSPTRPGRWELPGSWAARVRGSARARPGSRAGMRRVQRHVRPADFPEPGARLRFVLPLRARRRSEDGGGGGAPGARPHSRNAGRTRRRRGTTG